MKVLVRSAIGLAGLLLSGCLVSETPLFDASNASATPVAAGDYEACSEGDGEDGQDCNAMKIELGEDGLYVFSVDNDRIEARFLELSGGDYALQMAEQGDDYLYYWANIDGDTMSIVLLWCSDLPGDLVEELAEQDLMEPDEDKSMCTVKSADAVIAAAEAYASGSANIENRIVVRPAVVPIQ